MSAILHLFSHLERKSFGKGEMPLTQGESRHQLLILIEGAVEIVKDGVRVATSRESGSIFGEMSLLLHVPHTASVKTLEPSSFYVLENPQEFLNAHPEACLQLARLLAHRIDALNRYLIDVKQQFRSLEGHIGMVDEVLETLVHHQPRPARPPLSSSSTDVG